eukprot:4835882-Pleurochrysis_carterae.AAC.3
MQRRPSQHSKDADEKRLARWIGAQQSSYVKNAQIMKDVAIREEWTQFVDAQNVLFEDGSTTWR